MNETSLTPIPTPPATPAEPKDSTSDIAGVSVRGWLVILMTLSVCVICALNREVPEPLYTGFLMGLGFYLGQKFPGKST